MKKFLKLWLCLNRYDLRYDADLTVTKVGFLEKERYLALESRFKVLKSFLLSLMYNCHGFCR